ncbi:MAG: type II toxin-antitoxin system VapC family toxin [Gammaproteobacteria bacterium]
MTPATLINAGPLVAIFNRDDRDHDACIETLKRLREPLLTTWAPIAEAVYLLGFSHDAQSALIQMIERGALHVLNIDVEDLPEIRALMSKYADLPMDFADATLIHAANREGIGRIFTLDRRDFTVYRLKRGRTFSIVPTA